MGKSILYKGLGLFFVGLGAAGALLPVLPTTPFLILAASCFAKSSDKWYRWLLNNKQFGPAIRDWEEHLSDLQTITVHSSQYGVFIRRLLSLLRTGQDILASHG